jgi:GTP pyrophosphokinase
MRSIHFDSHDGITEGVVMFYVNNTKELNDVILSIKKITGISKVARVN